MMKMGFVVVVVMLLTSGCAVFRENNLPVINDASYTFKKQEKVKVYSSWTINTDNVHLSDYKKFELSEIHKGLFESIIIDSGCCMLIEGEDQTDVVVTGVVFDENKSAAMVHAFFTGVSLYTIPSWFTDNVHIQVDTKSTQQTKTYDLSDSVTVVQWLPLIFVLPFISSPYEGGNDIVTNVYRNLVVRMKADNLLSK